jgi:hypothetical protein
MKPPVEVTIKSKTASVKFSDDFLRQIYRMSSSELSEVAYVIGLTLVEEFLSIAEKHEDQLGWPRKENS